MYAAINGVGNSKSLYIMRSFRKNNGKTTSKVFKKLGRLDELLPSFDNDLDKLMAWAKQEAAMETEKQKNDSNVISVPFYPVSRIDKGMNPIFNIGYLFLQSLCSDLRLENICRNISSRHKFEFNIHSILTDLVYARILSPSSKLSSYQYCKSLLEPPKYSLQDLYRGLSIIAKETDYIQAELYKNSQFIHNRNTNILYYDCTNYFFEIEQEDGDKKYGKSKEHRPNPIIGMGLFMDTDGIPLAFDLFPGNQNEQKSLKPLEQKVIRDFGCSEFIYCSDSGLGSQNNKLFNDIGGRSYVITQSLKKLKKEDRDIALNPKQYRKLGSNKFIDLSKLDETDPLVYETIYYKEIPIESKKLSETLIVTYSPKYKHYQSKIRQGQIDRAIKMIGSGNKIKKTNKNPNDPGRFIRKTSVTEYGEVADKEFFELNQEAIEREAMYDGFYAVTTDMEGDVGKIIEINKRRWKIEECFRIMKSEFRARPVYLQRGDRIKAHFLTCFISLMIYRLMEIKLKKEYTTSQIIKTLQKMNVLQLKNESGYIPAYERTEITDKIHDIFGFYTDKEIITKASMRNIIKQSKQYKK